MLVKDVQRIRKRPFRDKTGLVIVEGYPEVSRAVKMKVPVETLFICPEIFTDEGGEFSHLDIVEVNKDEFEQMAFGERLKGILAICKPKQITLKELKFKNDNPLIIILEGVEKPGNLGAVLRTCDGAGADAVILCDGKTDVINPNVVRSSIGTIFTVPTVDSTIDELIPYLKNNGIKIFAATAHGQDIFSDCDMVGPTAIVVGNEHSGLTDEWINLADAKIKIPMSGEGQCLNVAISASILTYEAHRQRSKNVA